MAFAISSIWLWSRELFDNWRFDNYPAGDDNGGLMVKSALQLLCEIHPVLPVCGHLVFRLSGQEGVCSGIGSRVFNAHGKFRLVAEIADFCMLSLPEIINDQMYLIAENRMGLVRFSSCAGALQPGC